MRLGKIRNEYIKGTARVPTSICERSSRRGEVKVYVYVKNGEEDAGGYLPDRREEDEEFILGQINQHKLSDVKTAFIL